MYDLIIIGAGPAGISLAVEARTAGIAADKILILEKGKAHSWSLRTFYPDHKLVAANYKSKGAACTGVLCISDMSKDQALTYLDHAIEEHGLGVHYEVAVNAITHRADGTFEVGNHNSSYEGRVCVIAIGILGKPNRPDYRIPTKIRKKIHFDVTSCSYQGQNMLVVGGGDSASEYCQYLVQCRNKVTLSYRRDTFIHMTRLNRESVLALERHGTLDILRNSNIQSLSEEGGRPKARFAEGEPKGRTFDHIVYALGGSTPENFLHEAGIAFEGNHPKVTKGYETSIHGLYLIGDLTPDSGSIILAFNTAHEAIKDICDSHLGCKVPELPHPPPATPGEQAS